MSLRPSSSVTIRVLALVAGLVATLMVDLAASPPAGAAGPVTVRLVVERLLGQGNIDNFSDADFFARVTVDGESFTSAVIPDDSSIRPNWRFTSELADPPATVRVTADIWDADDFLNGDDDRIDVTAGAGRSLDLTVDLTACTFSGTHAGACGEVIEDRGTSGDLAEIDFRVEVDEPASADNLLVRCMHDSIWPNAGGNVTITAEALNNSLAGRTADTIEIWVDDTDTPRHVATGTATTDVTIVAPGREFTYGCRVVDDGVPVWTGWRRVSTTVPPAPVEGPQVAPLMVTAPTTSAIDIVFVADGDDYPGGPTSAAFEDNLFDTIKEGYFGATTSDSTYLRNQDQINFWVTPATGDASSSNSGCDHEYPEIPFADAIALLHVADFRDCAPGGENVFSSEWDSFRTLLHETGHRPFGLADEYCCDGGYFQTDTAPNLYREPDGCEADAPNLSRPADDCREFEETIDWWFDPDWSISEPASNDLMVDNRTPQAADVRRIDRLFDQCRSANCGGRVFPEANESRKTTEPSTDPRTDPQPDEASAIDEGDKVLIVDVAFEGRETFTVSSQRVTYGRPPAREGNPPLLRAAINGPEEQLLELSTQWHPLWVIGEEIKSAGGDVFFLGESLTVYGERTGTFVFPMHPLMRTLRLWDIAAGSDAIDDVPDDELGAVDVEPAIAAFCGTHSDDRDCVAYRDSIADGDEDGVRDAVDLCPGVADPAQTDTDGDGRGDACETPDRISGDTRIDTAVGVSQSTFPDGSADVVLLARSDDFPDALAGGPLAASLGAPLLLTDPATLSPGTATELSRVLTDDGRVLVLGGPVAVGPDVVLGVEELGIPTRRIAGADRFATAVAIAEELGDPDVLLLATGRNFPDALAAGAAAVAADGAVLLTGTDERAPVTDAYLDDRGTVELVAVGGPAARPYPEAEGLVGATRDATAVVVADRFFPSPVAVGMARNDVFADALAGGVDVAVRGGPILLTATDELSDEPADWLCRQGAAVGSATIYGGPAAVSSAVADAITARLSGVAC